MFRAQEVYSSFSVVAGVDEVECGVSAQHVIYLPITLAGRCGRRGPLQLLDKRNNFSQFDKSIFVLACIEEIIICLVTFINTVTFFANVSRLESVYNRPIQFHPFRKLSNAFWVQVNNVSSSVF